MTFTRAEAFAPATMANLGVGFDILGLALCEPGDTVVVERRDEAGVAILNIEGDNGRLPRQPQKNTASVAVMALLETLHIKQGIGLTIHKGLPLESGLGSSAASAVAAVVAVNALLGEPLKREELLPACLEGEALVSGRHADNVGPSLLGGITLITGTEISQIRKLPVPQNLFLALITPDISVPTAEARAVLPKTIPLKQMVSQTGGVARLIDGLYRGDIVTIAEAMESDSVVEPARTHLMSLLAEIRFAAKRAGALALVISGAGPTLCAICDNEAVSKQVAEAMQAIYTNAGINSISRAGKVCENGARVLSVS